MKIKININVEVGRVVKYFVLSDLFLLAGWGLVEPVFSVFVVQKVAGATLITVGVAAAIYWVLKSILQIPIAKYLDNTPGEKDDFTALVGGLFLCGASAFAFVGVSQAWELYAVQALHAVGFAFYVPSWSAVFSRHLDKDRVSFDWSLDSTAAGFAAGAAGLVSGVMAERLGFAPVFVIAGALSIAAAFIVMAVPDLLLPRPVQKQAIIKDHTPTNIGV